MKRLFIFLFIAVCASAVFAQTEREAVTVNGTLKLERGLIAVASGESVYLLPILNRYIGFINGLKEGENVSIEGYLFRNVLHPTKVTVAGQSYDFGARGQGLALQDNNRQDRRRAEQAQPNRQDRRRIDQASGNRPERTRFESHRGSRQHQRNFHAPRHGNNCKHSFQRCRCR
jgi:hypothetical protein